MPKEVKQKQQCSKCLGWFVNLDNHKSKACKAPCNGIDVKCALKGEPMDFYQRCELRTRFSRQPRKNDQDILPGDILEDGFNMLNELYED